MSIYLLYEGKAIYNQTAYNDLDIQVFRVKPFSKQGKGRIANLYWWLLCKKTFLCVIRNAETKEIMHYTYAMKKSYKFPFMGKSDYMIGPSVTLEKFRGKGLLGKGIAYMQNQILTLDQDAKFIALIREENTSSRKGIEKSGMSNTGKKYTKSSMKIYREVKERVE